MIPGSHAGRALLPHTTFHDPQNLALAEKTDDVDESLAEDLLLEAGQISLHDIFLVHGSVRYIPGQGDIGPIHRPTCSLLGCLCAHSLYVSLSARDCEMFLTHIRADIAVFLLFFIRNRIGRQSHGAA